MRKRHIKVALILFFIIGSSALYSQKNTNSNNDSTFRELINQIAVKPLLLKNVKPSAFNFVPIAIGEVQVGSSNEEALRLNPADACTAAKYGMEYYYPLGTKGTDYASRKDDEPLTKFVLTVPYYMQATEMPQGIYEAVICNYPIF